MECESVRGGHDGPPSQKCLAVWELLPSLVCPLTRGIMRQDRGEHALKGGRDTGQTGQGTRLGLRWLEL